MYRCIQTFHLLRKILYLLNAEKLIVVWWTIFLHTRGRNNDTELCSIHISHAELGLCTTGITGHLSAGGRCIITLVTRCAIRWITVIYEAKGSNCLCTWLVVKSFCLSTDDFLITRPLTDAIPANSHFIKYTFIASWKGMSGEKVVCW